MSVAIEAAPSSRVVPEKTEKEPQLVLRDVSWQSYVAIRAALADRGAIRITYDHGNLEIMTTSTLHEIYKRRLGRLVETLAEEFGMEVVSAGQMTFQREDLERGFEGDDCFWIAHEPEMRTVKVWTPERDPPPDLMLEIEISRSALDRMAIFAALGVPEIWCYDGASLRVYLLQADRSYQRVDRSLIFPTVPPEGIVPFLEPTDALAYLGTIRAFREWLRTYKAV